MKLHRGSIVGGSIVGGSIVVLNPRFRDNSPQCNYIGGQLSGGQLSGGQLLGGQLSGGQLSRTVFDLYSFVFKIGNATTRSCNNFLFTRPALASLLTVDNRKVTVLFETSITRHLDLEFISDNNTEFVNLSVSAAKLKNNQHSNIPDIATMMKDFVESQPITVSDLVALARKLFGQGVIISFRSVLPMRVMYDYTVENFLNFNRLLQTVPSQYKCYYIDWFWHFLDYNGDDINLLFYSGSIHLNRRGISYLINYSLNLPIRNRH